MVKTAQSRRLEWDRVNPGCTGAGEEDGGGGGGSSEKLELLKLDSCCMILLEDSERRRPPQRGGSPSSPRLADEGDVAAGDDAKRFRIETGRLRSPFPAILLRLDDSGVRGQPPVPTNRFLMDAGLDFASCFRLGLS